MAKRLLLGGQLHRLRESRGITAEQAAKAIRGSHSKISRLERGRVSFKERDVADLLTLYGVVDDGERAALLTLAREANVSGWWHAYSDVMPPWLEPYVGLEMVASFIRTYQTQLVPELLQTDDYAQALSSQGARPPAAEVARRCELRARRQEILRRPDAPHLWVVIDECALRRPIGNGRVVRDQVKYLAEMAYLPAVTLQILPFSAGAHPAMGGSFTILRFGDQELADVVYVEQLTGAFQLEKRAEVETYVEVMERVCVQAETPDRTISILEQILADV